MECGCMYCIHVTNVNLTVHTLSSDSYYCISTFVRLNVTFTISLPLKSERGTNSSLTQMELNCIGGKLLV